MQLLGSQTEMRSIDHRTHFAVDMGTIYCSVNSAVSVSPVARVSGHSIFLSRFPTLILMYRRERYTQNRLQGSVSYTVPLWTQHVTKPSKRCAFVSSPKSKYVDDRFDRSRDTRDRYVADRTRAWPARASSD